MLIKACHHHGFTVSDLERSVEFYRDVLGLELIRVSERSNLPSYDHLLGFEDVKLKVALLRIPASDFLLELFEYVNPPNIMRELNNNFVGASHVAFEVGDLDGIYDAICAAGYSSIAPPIDIVRDGRPVARGIYVLDPDGISIEMFQAYEDVVKD